jgi:hypothetical protein
LAFKDSRPDYYRAHLDTTTTWVGWLSQEGVWHPFWMRQVWLGYPGVSSQGSSTPGYFLATLPGCLFGGSGKIRPYYLATALRLGISAALH